MDAYLPQITVGSDPEFFVRDKETGKFVCAHGLVPGTKEKPHKVKRGQIQVDGFALEIGTDPATSSEQFSTNVETVKAELQKYLPKNLELVCQPTALFDQEYFDSCPDVAKELGCEPDYNAYTGQVNERPSTDKPMRTAAGHIHVGWGKGMDIADPDHFADCIEVVKQLDFYVGVPSLIWDDDQERRSLYGRAGAFRVKSYGVEYRTPSCMWTSDVSLQRFVWDAAFMAVSDLWNGVVARKIFAEDAAQQWINGQLGFNRNSVDSLRRSIRSMNNINLLGLWQKYKGPPEKTREELEYDRMTKLMYARNDAALVMPAPFLNGLQQAPIGVDWGNIAQEVQAPRPRPRRRAV